MLLKTTFGNFVLFVLLFLLFPSRANNISKDLRKSLFFSKFLEEHFLLSTGNVSVNAFLSHSYISLSCSNQFLLKELMNMNLQFFYIKNGNAAGIVVQHFGYQKYGAFELSVSYSRLFAGKVAAGVQLHYLVHHAFQYEVRHSLTFDLSFSANITDKLKIAMFAYNPVRLRYGFTTPYYIPVVLQFVSFYKINPHLLLHMSFEKSMPGHFAATFGVSYTHNVLVAGFTASNKSVAISATAFLRRFMLRIVSEYYYVLGYSPQFSCSYFF